MLRAGRGNKGMIGRSRFAMGIHAQQPWLIRLIVGLLLVLLPGLTALPAQALGVDPVQPTKLDIPNSTSHGSTTAPVQIAGSAEGLPHLVSSSATEGTPSDDAPTSSKTKRPKDSLCRWRTHVKSLTLRQLAGRSPRRR